VEVQKWYISSTGGRKTVLSYKEEYSWQLCYRHIGSENQVEYYLFVSGQCKINAKALVSETFSIVSLVLVKGEFLKLIVFKKQPLLKYHNYLLRFFISKMQSVRHSNNVHKLNKLCTPVFVLLKANHLPQLMFSTRNGPQRCRL